MKNNLKETNRLAADQPKNLGIIKAVYGDYPDGFTFDVTEVIRAMVEDNSLYLLPNRHYFGGVHAIDILKVDYVLSGVAGSKLVRDGESLMIGAEGDEGNPATAPMLTSDPKTWKPVSNIVTGPARGVSLGEQGLFRAAMERHTAYLLSDANLDDMMFRFRKTAGIENPPGEAHGWEKTYPAYAAQFLIGAGNTLRWGENAELRRRMNELIEAIKSCKTADGLLAGPHGIMAAPYGSAEEGYDSAPERRRWLIIQSLSWTLTAVFGI